MMAIMKREKGSREEFAFTKVQGVSRRRRRRRRSSRRRSSRKEEEKEKGKLK